MVAHRFSYFVIFFFFIFLSLCARTALAFPNSSPDLSILPAPDASGKWGYVDAATGKTLIAPKYIEADFFYDDEAIVTQAYPDEAYDAKTREGGYVRITPKRQGIINRNGQEIIEPMYVVSRVRSDFGIEEERGFVPRLFHIKGGKDESIIFRAGQGVVVPAGVHKNLRFTAEGGVFCDGDYYEPGGKRHSPPSGCEIAWMEKETGMFRVREKKEHAGLEGVMRQDGSMAVPVRYHEVDAVKLPDTVVWLASRGDYLIKARALISVLTGSDPDVSESKDILTVDVYDDKGKVLRSFRARYFPDVSGENYSYLSKGERYTVNARTGRPTLQPARSYPAGDFKPFQKDDNWGVKNADDTITVEPQFEKIFSLGGGLFAATRSFAHYRDNWGLIDGNGKEIMPFIYGEISACGYPSRATGPLLCMRWEEDPSSYWLVNRDGSFITPKDKPYHSYFYFNDAGQAEVWRNGRHGVIDYRGKEVLPCVYESVFDELDLNETQKRRQDPNDASKVAPKDALYLVELNNVWGMYDGTGRELIPVRYGFIHILGDGWARIESQDRSRYGLANFLTGQVIKPEYDSVRVCPGFFLAYEYGRDGNREAYVLLGKNGKPFARYGRAEWFENAGLLAARKGQNGKYALLDKSGKPLTPFNYESVSKAEGPFVWCWTDTVKVLANGKGKEYRIVGK